jgi:hypothetical protein
VSVTVEGSVPAEVLRRLDGLPVSGWDRIAYTARTGRPRRLSKWERPALKWHHHLRTCPYPHAAGRLLRFAGYLPARRRAGLER